MGKKKERMAGWMLGLSAKGRRGACSLHPQAACCALEGRHQERRKVVDGMD